MKWREIGLGTALALSVSALVALETFSLRIRDTLARDARSFLAADFRIQAWRSFDESVWKGVQKENAQHHVAERDDFVATAEKISGTAFTVSVAALRGSYPFYGNWEIQPAQGVEDLLPEPRMFVDIALKARGILIGDNIRLGAQVFKVAGYIQEEPQSVAGVFAAGPRVMIHKNWAEKTRLLGVGSRVFYQLLIKSNETAEAFQKRFRQSAPDPHWRLVTPEKAQRQAGGILNRIRGFLSFVLLGALFLGGTGLFMILRSRFLLELPTHLTLRCLGMTSGQLIRRAWHQVLGISLLSGIPGVILGLVLERQVVHYAVAQLHTALSEKQPWQGVFLGFLALVLVAALAVILPLREILRVPVQYAFRQSEAKTQGFSRGDFVWVLGVALILTFLFAGSWKLSAVFLGGLLLTLGMLAGAVALLMPILEKAAGFLRGPFQHVLWSFTRQRAQAYLIVVTLGLGTFLLMSILLLGAQLRSQVDFSGRLGVPNVFLLGVPASERAALQENLPGIEFVPTLQARLTALKGEAIQEAEGEEDESEQFYKTREYVVTHREHLGPGEELVSGASLFGEKASSSQEIRASLEVRFAERMHLQVGDALKIQIAGVELPARVTSLRKVNWFNLRPNFFIVLNTQDVLGAPFTYVGVARVPEDRMGSLQAELTRGFPEVTVLDGQSIQRRLLKLLDQLSLAVGSVTFFALGSCAFVFIGMLLARRWSKIQEWALLRCLGWGSSHLRVLIWGESLLCGVLAVGVGCLGAGIMGWALARFFLEIPWENVWRAEFLIFILGIPFLTALGGWLLMRPWLKVSPTTLFRAAEEAS